MIISSSKIPQYRPWRASVLVVSLCLLAYASTFLVSFDERAAHETVPRPPPIPPSSAPIDLAATPDADPNDTLPSEEVPQASEGRAPELDEIGPSGGHARLEPLSEPDPADTVPADLEELSHAPEEAIESGITGYSTSGQVLASLRIERIGRREVLQRWIEHGLLGFELHTDRSTTYVAAVERASNGSTTLANLRFERRHEAIGGDRLQLAFDEGPMPIREDMIEGLLRSQLGSVGSLQSMHVVFTPRGMAAVLQAEEDTRAAFGENPAGHLSLNLCLTSRGEIAVTRVTDGTSGPILSESPCE